MGFESLSVIYKIDRGGGGTQTSPGVIGSFLSSSVSSYICTSYLQRR